MSRAEISAPDAGREPLGERAGGRRVPLALVAAAGCATVLSVAGVRLAAELTRDPSRPERAAAVSAEVARRYQAWPSGRVFPAEIPYTLDQGSAETARRVGIDTDTRCGTAVDQRLGASLDVRGCRAVLRATYLDQPQGLAVTVAVVVLPDEVAARAVVPWFPRGSPRPGLRAVPFPGSVTARFGDAARQSAAVAQHGPYVVAATVGYADGRPALRAGQQQPDLPALGPQLVEGVLRPLTAAAPVRCDTPDWSC
ncbi:hypothetical protein [Actinomadura xylanilytica]|uniref:hypothetical protein n=1 Tax=Actinomadura xylanilytica TaxID=887459 RepID=UPI00255AF24F|nr:hypothetical protein [Actinomadura xylanilytica]MDL4772066.1 hypothetical protein [Actinomadura xylanilytica]